MKTFLILLLLFPLTTLAQTEALTADDLRNRAFQMTKATVEFLATDAKTYGYPDRVTCPECVSYPALKAFIVQQKLTKADELVTETERWVAAPVTVAKAPATALAELKAQLMNRVTAGTERQHRRTLASFASYEAQMNQLAGQSGATGAVQPEQTQANPVANDSGIQSDTAITEDTVEPSNQEGASAGKAGDGGWISKSGLALLLSLLSLGLAGWLLATRRKDGKSPTVSADSDMRVAKLNDELIHVKGESRQTIAQNERLKTRVEQLEQQVGVLQKAVGLSGVIPTPQPTPKPAAAPVATAAVPPLPPPAPAKTQAPPAPVVGENRPRSQSQGRVEPAPPAPTPKLLYARTVDLGDGFSTESLTESSERPMVYQIQVQGPTVATFRVSDDSNAQRLALSDPYSYLNDACEYSSQPTPNSRIQTTKPGRLVLQGNKWAIQEKAQIAFS